MNGYLIIPLSSFLFNSFVWIYIFAQHKKSRVNIAFLIYAANLSFWIIYVLVMRLNLEPLIIMPVIKAGSVAWLSVPFWFTNFTYAYLNKKKDTAFYAILSITLGAILISLSTDLLFTGYKFTYWGIDEVPGSLFLPVILIVISIPSLYALGLIAGAISKTTNLQKRLSLRLILAGSLISLTIGLLSNVVIPHMTSLGDYVHIAESGTVIQSLFIFRAVIKYKLFSLGVEEIAHHLFSNMNDAVIIINDQGNILEINRQAEILFQARSIDLQGRHVQEILESFNYRVPHQNTEQRVYVRGAEKILSITDVELSESAIRLGKILIARDITGQKRREEIIHKNRTMLKQAEQLAHLGSWEWDIKSNKLTWSAELLKIYRISKEEFEGNFNSYITRVHPDDRLQVTARIEEALAKRTNFEMYERIICPDNSVRILLSKGLVFQDENRVPIKLIGACLDVTEFKKVENDLRTSREQLRALSSSLEKAREEERTHIAREIHDELGQVLTAVKMDVVLLSEEISEKEKLPATEIVRQLKSVEKMTDRLIQTVRNIATELRSDVLEHLGVVAAIEWQLNEFENRTSIKCSFNNSAGFVEMGHEPAIAVFRVFQEALTNIIRHSGADCVEVNVASTSNSLCLEVKDNGKGITEEQINDIKSIGITGMKERCIMAGGKFMVKGEMNMGTVVSLEMPFKLSEVKEM